MGRRMKTILGVLALGLAVAAMPAVADEFRDIVSVTGDVYFDNTYFIESENVFLAQLVPTLSIQVGLKRDDYLPDWAYADQVSFGPVVSLTAYVYFVADYGITFDSDGSLSHEGNIEVTFENDTTSGAFGMRGDFFPVTGYFYVLPSVSALFHPVDQLGLFGKVFLSWDATNTVTVSLWNENTWTFNDVIAARLGFTLGWANGLGWSAIAGADWSITPSLKLRYNFQYLSNTIEYVTAPVTKNGIENALVMDVKF